MEAELCTFLTSVQDEAERLASYSITRKNVPGIHWTGGWVDPTDGLEMEKRKIHVPKGNRISAVQPVASNYIV
jgi:hypothetical protein